MVCDGDASGKTARHVMDATAAPRVRCADGNNSIWRVALQTSNPGASCSAAVVQSLTLLRPHARETGRNFYQQDR